MHMLDYEAIEKTIGKLTPLSFAIIYYRTVRTVLGERARAFFAKRYGMKWEMRVTQAEIRVFYFSLRSP